MMVESNSSPLMSWKDKLLGVESGALGNKGSINLSIRVDEELDFLEGDIYRSIVNGIPAIDFSERIQQILFKERELTVVLKLLGRNIRYGALYSWVSSL
ncbi:hypothetical protein J1N35_018731 [Gossypium stocksii]|uniref:Uncharacterized protein n=1 Tax=Gossypium stocksii TaxID=47602 RepID=A0A9D3VQ85_9ROSI|nr:hypothetical protein J1N35_018731 [Gossypium stocksii]